MPTTIRFPHATASVKYPAETNQIITILPATATLAKGGATSYVDVSAWKFDGQQDEAPYTDIVVEFTANSAFVLGDGTARIGLFGEITGVGKFLLGVLGVNLGQSAPQVPIVARADAALVGFAQVVCNVAAYDKLSVGGVSADIGTGDPLVTVKARPIRKRNYVG